MSRGSTGFALVAAACLVLGGCEWKDETGFVEIRKAGAISLGPDDVLILNSTEIANLAQKDHLIVQEPVGATSLQLKRGEKSQKLCDLVVKKNRVVTVTVTYVDTIMRCAVQT